MSKCRRVYVYGVQGTRSCTGLLIESFAILNILACHAGNLNEVIVRQDNLIQVVIGALYISATEHTALTCGVHSQVQGLYRQLKSHLLKDGGQEGHACFDRLCKETLLWDEDVKTFAAGSKYVELLRVYAKFNELINQLYSIDCRGSR